MIRIIFARDVATEKSHHKLKLYIRIYSIHSSMSSEAQQKAVPYEVVYQLVRATNFCSKHCKTLLKESLLPMDSECLQ